MQRSDEERARKWLRATYPQNQHARGWAAEIARVFLGEPRVEALPAGEEDDEASSPWTCPNCRIEIPIIGREAHLLLSCSGSAEGTPEALPAGEVEHRDIKPENQHPTPPAGEGARGCDYQVGDRIRVKRSHPEYQGLTGVVTHVGEWTVDMLDAEGDTTPWDRSSIELDPTPPAASEGPRCTLCSASRIVDEDGRPGACSLVPGKDGKGGCPDPMHDVRAESPAASEGRPRCASCGTRTESPVVVYRCPRPGCGDELVGPMPQPPAASDEEGSCTSSTSRPPSSPTPLSSGSCGSAASDEERARTNALLDEAGWPPRSKEEFLAFVAAVRAEATATALQWTEDDKPISEDEQIEAAFPTRSMRYDIYFEAMRMVGAKRSKGALVALVNWLLCRCAEATEAERERCARECEDVSRYYPSDDAHVLVWSACSAIAARIRQRAGKDGGST